VAIAALTTDTFDAEVKGADTPVLVDFWAEWCGPCRQMKPVVERFATEYDGRVKVAMVNIDEEPALAARYGVSSIPTLLLLDENGDPTAQLIGARPFGQLENAVTPHLT
jgi:thioredoxin 1